MTNVVENYSSLEDLVARVDENEGILTTTMRALRDAYGAERLGSIVRESISSALKGRGLSHQPGLLPGDQAAIVRIYRLGGPVEEVIRAVARIGPKSDAILRERAANSASLILQKVKELVCG